ncbi:MAG: LysR family transcriptional regulator [Pseudomonadota bacterium]
MSLDLKSVELFVRIASVGAIGKAGAEFGLSPTAATQRVQALEKVLGIQLFHRSTRAVTLSAEGELFLGHANRIIAGVADAMADVQQDPHSLKGELRVASSASFGRQHLAPYVVEFLAHHPDLSVQLQLSDAKVDIIDQGFDLAIRLGELAPSALLARKLGRSPRVLVAAPSYLARHGHPRSPEELKDHHCLIRGDMRTWDFRTRDQNLVQIKVSGKFTTNLAEAITEAAVAGLGIARKCKWEVADQIADGRLLVLCDDYALLPEWDVYAVRPPSRVQPQRVRVFVDFLEDKFSAVPALAGR